MAVAAAEAAQKLQEDIKAVLTESREGTQKFKELWDQMASASTGPQKERLGEELKSCINKLQGLRSQMLSCLDFMTALCNLKDELEEGQKVIEKDMSRFEDFERREFEKKAFSGAGRAVRNFDPQSTKEVPVRTGDQIDVLEMHRSGWSLVKNLSNRSIPAGWVPTWSVEQMPATVPSTPAPSTGKGKGPAPVFDAAAARRGTGPLLTEGDGRRSRRRQQDEWSGPPGGPEGRSSVPSEARGPPREGGGKSKSAKGGKGGKGKSKSHK